jgi:hypothetical protein
MSGEDAFEAEELERAAEWRMRLVDADPADVVSRDAAVLLETLAREVRALRGAAVFREYVAICNWLGESDGLADFMDMAGDYRARIGVDRKPADGEAYIRLAMPIQKRRGWCAFAHHDAANPASNKAGKPEKATEPQRLFPRNSQLCQPIAKHCTGWIYPVALWKVREIGASRQAYIRKGDHQPSSRDIVAD